MPLSKKHHKFIFLVLFLLTAGAALFYFYFIRVDALCYGAPSDSADACYSVDILDIIPIARAEISSNGDINKGGAALKMKITPIGLAATLANGNRFELFSAFRTDDGEPEEFAISLYDRNGLRYVKTSSYDFEKRTIRWVKSYPPARNRKSFVKEYSLDASSLSPLSAFYLMTRKPSGEQALKIQVQDIPYIARNINSTHEGGVLVSTYAIGKDNGRVEAWRRRMDIELDLFFSCGPSIENGASCFPFRIDLPFNIITMTSARSSQPRENGR